MRRLHPIPARRLLRALQGEGFEIVSQRGSHIKLRHPDGRVVVVPGPASRTIGVGLLADILKEAQIDRERL